MARKAASAPPPSSFAKLGALRLSEHFVDSMKKGIVLSVKAMKSYCRDQGYKCPPENLLRQMRYKFKFSALHTKSKRPASYMGTAIPKLGVIFVDMAVFQPRLKVKNGQNQYILVGVDELSNKLAAVPLPNKNRRSWERALEEMRRKESFPFMQTIVTDRDGAVADEAFQKAFKRKHGVAWIHLPSRSKAFLAETMIGHLKSNLSIALGNNAKGDNCWTKHLPGIVASYNEKMITGTNIKRKDISRANYGEVIAKRLGAKDYAPLINTSVSSHFSKEMRQLLFKFQIGDKVLLARSAHYNVRMHGGKFAKKSVIGSYGDKVYTVKKCLLKSNDRFFLNPVYRLSRLKGLYYSSELIPFSGVEMEDSYEESVSASERGDQSSGSEPEEPEQDLESEQDQSDEQESGSSSQSSTADRDEEVEEEGQSGEEGEEEEEARAENSSSSLRRSSRIASKRRS